MAEISCEPILTMDQAFAGPQVQHLGMAEPVEHPRLGPVALVAQPIRISRSQGRVNARA